MTREQAHKILNDFTNNETWEATAKKMDESYPGLGKLYLDYIYGQTSSVIEFRNKAVRLLQLSDTKLHKALR